LARVLPGHEIGDDPDRRGPPVGGCGRRRPGWAGPEEKKVTAGDGEFGPGER